MTQLTKRSLGTSGLKVSAIGLGCMGMSDFYGPRSDSDSLKTLRAAADLNITFWDTSDIYGPKTNEQLIGKYFTEHPGSRDDITIATKFGVVRSDDGEYIGVNGRPNYVKKACENSLSRLGVETIDLYYQHRMDPEIPIEETVGAMAELVQEGKVRYLGLSEAGAETLERAHKVHPISALQSEYSLWSRDLESKIIPKCSELGIGLVAYSPLGRGFLTGQIKSRNDFSADDWRLTAPRFNEQNFGKNLAIVKQVQTIADEKGCTPAQLALAWVLSKSGNFIPIPGTRNIDRLCENANALSVELDDQDILAIDRVFPLDLASGQRYPAEMMTALEL